MKKIIKIILIIAVAGALLFIGFKFFSKSPEPASPLSSSDGSTPADASAADGSSGTSGTSSIGNEFVDLLLNLNTIQLDTSIFDSQSFKALHDYSSPLTPEANPGRPNPFAPVGMDATLEPNTFSVITSPVTQILSTTATISGLLPSGTVATDRWFEWGTAETIPLSQKTASVAQDISTGVFTFGLTGLTPNTTYYVRSVAKVGTAVIVYGDVVSFKTAAATK